MAMSLRDPHLGNHVSQEGWLGKANTLSAPLLAASTIFKILRLNSAAIPAVVMA